MTLVSPDWHPWHPDGYPIRDPSHNPWTVVDPISGQTAYEVWCANRPIGEKDFRALLRTLRTGESE